MKIYARSFHYAQFFIKPRWHNKTLWEIYKMTRIKEVYKDLIIRMGHSQAIALDKWEIISSAYNSSSRFYHNLHHLESMLFELEKVKSQIKDWDSTLFSLFYHDLIYDTSRTDNEEQSAKFALKELTALNISSVQIEKVNETIQATKSHVLNSDQDINYFLDADLSILGADKDVYKNYTRNVRLEFLQYPSFVFNKGRVGFLEYLLSRDRIYNTDYFKKHLEQKAIENLKGELNALKRMHQIVNGTNTTRYVKYLEVDGNLHEFFYNCAKILDQTNEIEKIMYHPGRSDSGCYRFKYKGTLLHLEYEASHGTLLRTNPDASDVDASNAEEIFQKLIEVQLTAEDLERARNFYSSFLAS